MKRLIMLLPVLLLLACAGDSGSPVTQDAGTVPAGTREDPFVGEGTVREIRDDGALIIDHGEIPGFMSAMTMGFPTAEASLLQDVEVGDEIRFEVETFDEGYHIFALAPVERSSSGIGAASPNGNGNTNANGNVSRNSNGANANSGDNGNGNSNGNGNGDGAAGNPDR